MDYSFLLPRPELIFPKPEFDGARVLITGAGGTIGSTIAKQLAGYPLERLALVGHSEYNLFKLQKELGCPFAEVQVRDVRLDTEDLFYQYKPEMVIHAAAHKHVGLMESQSKEAFENNTMATIRLCNLAKQHRVSKFIFISTDKAVNPTSVMGASKRLAEMWIQANYPQGSIVRFGNVLGSSGSLVEILEERIKQGRAIVLTDPDMQRYFITAAEAAGLVLTSASFAPGMYSLNMGSPIRIIDIVRKLMARRGIEVPILWGTPGSGEKIEEALLNPGEKFIPVIYSILRILSNHIADAEEVEYRLNKVEHGGSIIRAANE